MWCLSVFISASRQDTINIISNRWRPSPFSRYLGKGFSTKQQMSRQGTVTSSYFTICQSPFTPISSPILLSSSLGCEADALPFWLLYSKNLSYLHEIMRTSGAKPNQDTWCPISLTTFLVTYQLFLLITQIGEHSLTIFLFCGGPEPSHVEGM